MCFPRWKVENYSPAGQLIISVCVSLSNSDQSGIGPICQKINHPTSILESAHTVTNVKLLKLHLFICTGLVLVWVNTGQRFSSSKILSIHVDPNPLVTLFGVSDDQVTLPPSKSQALLFCSCWRVVLSLLLLHELMFSLKLEKFRNLLQHIIAKFYMRPFLDTFQNP